MQEEVTKRRTHTSSEVKTRYNKKTYVQYNIKLRRIEDADIIRLIEQEKSQGLGTSDAIKNLIKKSKKD